MDPDELDEFLDGKRADLEARFEELETEAEIDRMRNSAGAPPPRRERAAATDDDGDAPADAPPAGADPLTEMKDALDGDGEMERYLLVVCPGCKSKNRMSMTKVRTAEPKCGKCKQDLSFTKF